MKNSASKTRDCRFYVTTFGTFALGALCALADPTTYYVDCNRPDDSGDGKSETNAFRTIQAAVEKCPAGGIVTVLPGVYAEGGKTNAQTGNKGNARVYWQNKSITLRSRDGAETTIIEGKPDPNSDFYGMGENAYRCLLVVGGDDSQIIGFTFRNGTTMGTLSVHNDVDPHCGGGAMGPAGVSAFTIVDSVFENCLGTRGGALYGGKVVRCRFFGNRATNFGAVSRGSAAYNCLFARNRCLSQTPGTEPNWGTGTVAYPCDVVNCTFVDNDGYAIVHLAVFCSGVYNCVFANSNQEWSDSDATQHKMAFNCVATSSRIENTSANNNRRSTAYEVFSPLTHDYRLHTRSVARGAGSREWLSRIPAAYADKALDGAPMPAEGPLNAGCFQGAPAVPATSFIGFAPTDGTMTNYLDGVALPRDVPTHFASETWPVGTMHCRAVPNGASNGVLRYRIDRDTTEGYAQMFPDEDDGLIFMPPPADEHAWRITPVLASNVWVDCKLADYAGHDGSTPALAFETIQDGIASYNGNLVVNVKPGRYAKGGGYVQDASNRVCIAGHWGIVRVRSTGGRDVTFIEGAKDPSTAEDPVLDGCGPAAMRCVAGTAAALAAGLGSTAGCVQGFTLTGGRGYGNGSDTTQMRGGGALLDAIELLDCTITNCVASRGAAVSASGSSVSANGEGVVRRCLIADCRATVNGVTRDCNLFNCVFTGCTGPGVVWQGSHVYQTTVAGNSPAAGYSSVGSLIAKGFGVVAGATAGAKDLNGTCANLFYSILQDTGSFAGDAETTLVNENPCFVGAGDWRLYACSPAAGFVSMETIEANIGWLRFSGRDAFGVPYRFDAENRTVAGGIATMTAGCRGVAAALGGVIPVGPVPVTEAGQVVFTATGDRGLAGWLVNGKPMPNEGQTLTLDVAPTDASGAPSGYVVQPVYGSMWYVDAEHGDDDRGTGYTPETAKKTLSAVVSKTIAGDTVIAAPGDYRTGTMASGSNATAGGDYALDARVSLPRGVTLASRDGAAATFITGEGDWEADSTYGLGAKAVRCVFMYENSRLSGFTLRDGRTKSGSETSASCGGGVLAVDRSAWVEDCVLTNCASTRGGAARFCSFNRCRFIGNLATVNAAAVRQCNVLNSFADWNVTAGGDFGVFYSGSLENVTVGPNNRHVDGTELIGMFDSGLADTYAFNCLFCSSKGVSGGTYSNCAFRTGAPIGGGVALLGAGANVFGDVSVDAEGHPLAGNVAIDAANPTINRLAAMETADLCGGQRLYNGAYDIGCCEFDWRGIYSKRLKRKNLAVVAASGNVTDAVTGVSLGNGDLMDIDLTVPVDGECSFAAAVVGGGTLTATVDGAEIVPAGGVYTFNGTADVHRIHLAFAGEGSVTVSQFKSPGLGAMILLR